MSPLVLGPRAHRPLRGAVAAAHARRRAADRPALRRRLRRVQAPPSRPAERCRSSTPPTRAPTLADVRERVLDVLATVDARRRRRPAARRRLRLRHGRPARAPARRDACSPRSSSWRRPLPDPAPSEPSAAVAVTVPGAAEVVLPGGPFMMGTDAEPWAYDNERPAHAVEVAPFRIDTHAGHQRGVRRVRRRRRLRRPAAVDRRRLGVAQEAGLVAPAVLAPRGAAATTGPCCGSGAARARLARRAGAARVLVRGRRVRALGRHGCRPRPSGRSRRRGATAPAPLPVGRRDPDDSLATSARPPRPRRGGHARARASAWSRWSATSGSGPRPTSAATRASGRSRTASTREVFFGAPSTRCCAAVRGRRTRSRCARRSATGTTRSAARSSPASAARATPDPTMCRHLAYLGPPVDARRRCCSRRRTRSSTRRARPRSRRAGATNPDGWGVALVSPTTARRPSGTAPPRRSGTTPRSPRARGTRTTSGAVLAAAASRRRAPRSRQRQRAVRRRQLAVLAERRRRRLPRRRRRRAARQLIAAADVAGIEGDTDSEVLFALVLDRLDAGAPARRPRSRTSVDTVDGPHDRPPEPAAHRRRTGSRPPRAATRCSCARGRRASRASRPSRSTTTRLGARPRPLRRRGRRARTSRHAL